MLKWLVLAAGVFLFFNGINSRTFSFENESPPRHCYYMDYIGANGCFSSPAPPAIITWGALLIGAAMIGRSLVVSRRKAPTGAGR
jgi:hypothetical protein